MPWRALILVVSLLAASGPATAGEIVHTVKAGENPAALAKRYHVSVAAILARNQGVDPRRIKIGDVLVIPDAAAGPAPAVAAPAAAPTDAPATAPATGSAAAPNVPTDVASDAGTDTSAAPMAAAPAPKAVAPDNAGITQPAAPSPTSAASGNADQPQAPAPAPKTVAPDSSAPSPTTAAAGNADLPQPVAPSPKAPAPDSADKPQALAPAPKATAPGGPAKPQPAAPPPTRAQPGASPKAVLPDEEAPGHRYVVVPGDCPADIAERFGIPLEVLWRANPGLDPKRLPVGCVLTVPEGAPVAPPAVAVTRPGDPGSSAPLVMDFQ